MYTMFKIISRTKDMYYSSLEPTLLKRAEDYFNLLHQVKKDTGREREM